MKNETTRRDQPIYVHTPDQIPNCEHYAIFQGESVTIPGDERSRTNPGHGYPEHTDYHVSYEAYIDRAAFEKAVQERAKPTIGYARTFRIAKITPLEVKIAVSVSIGDSAGPSEDTLEIKPRRS